LTVAACLVVSCKGEVRQNLEQGDELLYEQKYARAESAYGKALKRLDEQAGGRETKRKEALEALGHLLQLDNLYLHNYPQAVEEARRIVADFPESREALSAQATIADIEQHKLGNLPQAVNDYQKLISKFKDRPETPRYQLELVRLYFAMRNYDQAVHEAQKLVATWPQSPEVPQAYFEIGSVNYISGKFQDALAAYEVILKQFPDNTLVPLARFEMASCYQELGNDSEALKLLYEALKNHPHPQVVQRKIARIQHRQSQLTASNAFEPVKSGAKIVRKKAAVEKNAPEEEEASSLPTVEGGVGGD
jgi:tetratricopeptide (TPR) repeat protein